MRTLQGAEGCRWVKAAALVCGLLRQPTKILEVETHEPRRGPSSHAHDNQPADERQSGRRLRHLALKLGMLASRR